MRFKIEENYNDVVTVSCPEDIKAIDKDHTRVIVLSDEGDVWDNLVHYYNGKKASEYITHLSINSDCIGINYPLSGISIPNGSWPNLRKVEILSDFDHIPNFMFTQSPQLKKVDIKGHIGGIGKRAFAGCSSLSDFDFSKVDDVGFESFSACGGLRNLDLTNVKSTASYAFEVSNFDKVKINTSAHLSGNMFLGTGIYEMTLVGTGDFSDIYSAHGVKFINISKDVNVTPEGDEILQHLQKKFDTQVRYF